MNIKINIIKDENGNIVYKADPNGEWTLSDDHLFPEEKEKYITGIDPIPHIKKQNQSGNNAELTEFKKYKP